jgi:RNA polymerase primary sigma factor
VADESAISPFDHLRAKNLNSDLHSMFTAPEPREAEIIRLRFGFDGLDALTLEEVGQRFRITRERVRQLQTIAIRKMRRAMAQHEARRSVAEIEQEARQLRRAQVIHEFIAAKLN